MFSFVFSKFKHQGKSGTKSSYESTERNLTDQEDVPIFCQFIDETQIVTPSTAVELQENLSFFLECVDPNLCPNEDILASIESQNDEEDEEIF